MNINEIKASVPAQSTIKATKTVTAPQVQSQEKQEKPNDKSGLALKNYFLGTQNIPSFKGFDCTTGNFNRQIGHTTCACCGKEMIDGDIKSDELAGKFTAVKGEDRTKFIDEHMSLFRPTEKAYARAIREEGIKNPEAKTADLIMKISRNPEQTLKMSQLAVLNDIDAEAKEHLGDKNKVSEYIKGQRPLVTGQERNSKFNREKVLDDLERITADEKDADATGHILNKAIDLPFEDVFFKRLNKSATDPRKFSRLMFLAAVKTAEHIHPESLDGPCNTGNYMSECKECNGSRGNYDLNTYWQTRYPSMPYNVQQYANHVTGQIVDGKIPATFVDYPKDLKVAVEGETKGAIKLTILNPEEINKKRAEKGLEPLPMPKPPVDPKSGEKSKIAA